MLRRESAVDADKLNFRIEAVATEVEAESDRSAVILAVAEIDQALRDLLDSFVLPPSAASKKYGFTLFGQDEPAGTLSARIELAYRLGLIPAWCQRETHVLRRIRNEFAHKTFGYTFASSPASELLLTLEIPKRTRAAAKRGDFSRNYWQKPKNLFAISALAVVAEVVSAHCNVLDEQTTPIQPCRRRVRFESTGQVLE
jgi:DNA-binding MltR family transcriptional regulator